LVSAAYRRNIDFKTGDNIFDKLLNIKHISSVVKFILANEVDMLPCDRGKSEYRRVFGVGLLIEVEITKHSLLFQGLQADVLLAHEVAVRIMAEKSLQKESQKYLTLLHNANDGIHIIDMNYILIEANNSMLGYTREEMIDMHVSQWRGYFWCHCGDDF
jgi:PAS domain-containing protein